MGQSTAEKNSVLAAKFVAGTLTGVAAVYLALHLTDPGTTGAGEAAGSGYTRQLITFAIPVGGSTSNTGVISFNSVPLATFNYLGIWDALSNGNFIEGGPLGFPITTQAGDVIQFAAASISATES